MSTTFKCKVRITCPGCHPANKYAEDDVFPASVMSSGKFAG